MSNTPEDFESARESVREQLEMFLFFHLGSDAEMEWLSRNDRFEIKISHRRVHPFRFQLEAEEVWALASSSDAFEEFMLQKLTHFRRH